MDFWRRHFRWMIAVSAALIAVVLLRPSFTEHDSITWGSYAPYHRTLTIFARSDGVGIWWDRHLPLNAFPELNPHTGFTELHSRMIGSIDFGPIHGRRLDIGGYPGSFERIAVFVPLWFPLILIACLIVLVPLWVARRNRRRSLGSFEVVLARDEKAKLP